MKIIPFILFVVLAFFLGRGLFLEPRLLPSTQIGKPLPDFDLEPLMSAQKLKASDFKQQVILLNVWASWCASCAEEQPFLLKLAKEGLTIYGLNYKDNPEAAKTWLATWGNPYQLIGQDPKGRAAMDLGVYGTPECFLIDKQGRIRYKHVGILTAALWEKEIAPLQKHLEQE